MEQKCSQVATEAGKDDNFATNTTQSPEPTSAPLGTSASLDGELAILTTGESGEF